MCALYQFDELQSYLQLCTIIIMKKISKNGILKFCLIFVLCLGIIYAFLAIGLNAYTKFPASSALIHSRKGFKIPYSNKGYVAQGLSYDKDSGNFYLTGYMKDGSASPIFVVNKKTRKLVNAVWMANQDGSEFCGHAGGLSVMNGKIYVAGSEDGCLYVFSQTEVDKAPKGSSVEFIEIVDLGKGLSPVLPAYTTVSDGLIFAGEFYRPEVYETPAAHQVQTEAGLQHAIAVGYELNGKAASPAVVYSVPDQIQGMCFARNAIYLTTSWGLGLSAVYVYDRKNLVQSGTKEVSGYVVPLYNLTMDNMIDVWVLPPMAEEIEFVDGRFYVSNESASNKYIFGKFCGGKWCRGYTFN